jgi:hypothetical protein
MADFLPKMKFLYKRIQTSVGGTMNRSMFYFGLTVLIMLGCASAPEQKDNQKIDFNQPYLELKFTYNYDVYQKPSFFLPKSQPTFAIWLEEKDSGILQTIYVTGKAGKNKWILAEARPESVPVWYGVRQKEKAGANSGIDAITGATPSGETAVILWQVPRQLRGKQVAVFIEANNSFDHNAHYTKQKGTAGYSAENGQPSLIWRAELDFSQTMDEHVSPEIIGHGSVLGEDHQIDPDISKITTARDTFSYMGLRYVDGR